MLKHLPLLLVVALSLVGCGSDDPETVTTDTGTTPADTGAAQDDTSAPADTGAASDADPSEVDPEAAAKPATPEIVSVMPMAGAWHVTWKANDTGLTKIELWRSNDGAAATLVKSFGGTAKDWHDGAATGTTVKYCYTVKTFRGTMESDPSPEKCSK